MACSFGSDKKPNFKVTKENFGALEKKEDKEKYLLRFVLSDQILWRLIIVNWIRRFSALDCRISSTITAPSLF